MSRNHHNVEMDLLEVKDAFMSVVSEGKPVPRAWGRNGHTESMRDMARSLYEPMGFYADGKATPADVCGWVRDGFESEAMAIGASFIATEKKAREVYDDFDGEDIDLDRLYSGDTNFFVSDEPREIKPGLVVNIEMNFNGHVRAEIINQYGGWIAEFIQGLEIQGYDMEVNLTSTTADGLQGAPRGNKISQKINVKRSGEQSRFSAWSCLFAPGAYRSIMWTGECIGAVKAGYTLTHGLGMAKTPPEWAVKFDREANTVTLDCHGDARKFDGEKMTADAKKHGLI